MYAALFRATPRSAEKRSTNSPAPVNGVAPVAPAVGPAHKRTCWHPSVNGMSLLSFTNGAILARAFGIARRLAGIVIHRPRSGGRSGRFAL